MKRIALISSICIIIVGGFCLSFGELSLLDAQEFDISNYDDGETTGNSTSQLTVAEDVCLSYTLGNKGPHPFAGIKIDFKNPLDLSSKEKITLAIKSDSKRRIHLFYNSLTSTGLSQVYRLGLDIKPNQSKYFVNLNDFKTPTWWFKKNQISEEENQTNGLSEVVTICIENDIWSQLNTEDQICIQELKCSANNEKVMLWTLVILIFSNGGLFLYQKLSSQQSKVISYQAVEVEESTIETDEKSDIINYISKNYTDPELTLKKIRQDLKIPENKISAIIKDEFNVSYKDYVQDLRINEAKRLLSTKENLNINEVATLVGYGSISTFNRVFKERVGKTPGEFSEEK